MPEAFITNKTDKVVSLQYGGEIEGIGFVDGEAEVKKGDTFFDWTFEALQKETATKITYTIPPEDEE